MTMNGRRIGKMILNCFATAFIYLVMYYLSYRVFREYLFVWTADNRYWYTWGKYIISYSITFGSIAGTFTGQYLGDYIQKIRMEKITLYSTAEERWHLSLHYGVAIWLAVILIFLVASVPALWSGHMACCYPDLFSHRDIAGKEIKEKNLFLNTS